MRLDTLVISVIVIMFRFIGIFIILFIVKVYIRALDWICSVVTVRISTVGYTVGSIRRNRIQLKCQTFKVRVCAISS